MTQPIARFGMNVFLCSLAIPAIAAPPEQTSQPGAEPPPPVATDAPFTIIQRGTNVFRPVEPTPAEQGAKMRNRIEFVTGDQANERAQRMRERLGDPEQRVALRAEQRAAVAAQNTGVGRLVGLDPVMEQQLIELLTDQQMEQLQRVHLQPGPNFPDLQQAADEITQRMNALRALLGDEKLERFQDFETSRSGRYWVSRLSERLAPADQLQPDQVDRLTALKHEQFERASVANAPWRSLRPPRDQPISFEDLRRDSQRQTRVANENAWRRRHVENRALEQQAASFLTSAQLAELSRYQAEEQDDLRRYLESARAQAGLDPTIPEQPEVVEEAPKLIDARVQVEVSLIVNREPTKVMRTVRTGESFTFEAAQGLIVEATPMMYDHDWIYVQLKYYEDGATGRRRLSGGSISTSPARPSAGSPGAGGGSSGTVITGRKGYAVETSIDARVL